MVRVRAYTGKLYAKPNPSPDGSYTLSWDARVGYPFHILLEGAAGATSKMVAYAGESRALLVTGKAAGTHRYELHHCNVTMVTMPFPLTLTSCAGTDIPDVTVTVNAPVGASNIVTRTEAGATPYRTGVTQGGDAYVNIPIEPAPGVNGLVPMISIDYSGGRDAELAEQSQPWDTLGYGWHLSGFFRCPPLLREPVGVRGQPARHGQPVPGRRAAGADQRHGGCSRTPSTGCCGSASSR